MVRLSERGDLELAQGYGRHRGIDDLLQHQQPDLVTDAPIEHAVVEALLRASLEVHSGLSLLDKGGTVADQLQKALDCLDDAVGELRREVASRLEP